MQRGRAAEWEAIVGARGTPEALLESERDAARRRCGAYSPQDVLVCPTKRRRGVHPHIDQQTRNALLVGSRAVAERANDVLVLRWHALRRVTLAPAVVGVITAAALVLTRFENAHGQG